MADSGRTDSSTSTVGAATAARPGARRAGQRATFIPKGREARLEAGEDYALNKVPAHFKRTAMGFAMPLTGLSWSMFFFAVGGTLALAFGFWSTMVALGITTIIGVAGLMTIPRLSTMYSLNLDLLTRGSGYGFLGSAVTSFIYALNWLMYAGLEAAFMASALHTQWHGIPLSAWYVVTSLITIPFNWYGITQNDFFQRITFPLFIAGLVWLMIKVLGHHQHQSFGAHRRTFPLRPL